MAAEALNILIMAALYQEVRLFLRARRARRLPEAALPTWEFKAGEGRGAAVISGMGEAAAREAADLALARYAPGTLLAVGFGGAMDPELPPGAVVLGQSFWRYDPNRGGLGQIATPQPPRPLPDILQALRERGLKAYAGALITTPVIIHKARHAAQLAHLKGAVLDLESTALAEVAAAGNIPFLAIRAISDTANEEIPDFIAQAASVGEPPTVRQALTWITRDPRRLKQLLHLWMRSTTAARNLARALEVVVGALAG